MFRHLLFIQEKQLPQFFFYPPNSVIKLSILKVLELEAQNYLLDTEIKEGNDKSSLLFIDSISGVRMVSFRLLHGRWTCLIAGMMTFV